MTLRGSCLPPPPPPQECVTSIGRELFGNHVVVVAVFGAHSPSPPSFGGRPGGGDSGLRCAGLSLTGVAGADGPGVPASISLSLSLLSPPLRSPPRFPPPSFSCMQLEHRNLMSTNRGRACLILILGMNADCESMAHRSSVERESARSVERITTGITGCWQTSVHGDVAFCSLDVSSPHYCDTEDPEYWAVHPLLGNVRWETWIKVRGASKVQIICTTWVSEPSLIEPLVSVPEIVSLRIAGAP